MEALKQLNDTSNKILELIPEIVYIGDPILRSSTHSTNLEEGLEISKSLGNTLKEYRNLTGIGRGLAAPQIGINKSVFVTYVDDKFQTYINPKILAASEGKNLYKENCLSSCHVWCDVIRSESITLQYMNDDGETVIREYSGFLARLIQHEVDHLYGVVNVDRAERGTIDYRTGDPLKEILRDL